MTDKQPDPLICAHKLRDMSAKFKAPSHDRGVCNEAIDLLRTQHAAIERKDALLRQALETMCCETSENMDDPGHRCGHCDDYVDRNGTLRAAITKELSQ